MSQITYNGISLSMVNTIDFQQRVEYDKTGIDYLWTKIHIRAQCVFNNDLQPARDQETPAQTMLRVRAALLSPRHTLTYQVGSDVLISSPVSGQEMDSNNGPHPIACDIMHLNDQTFIVTFEIETYISECGGAKSQVLPYLSNRWVERHDIDTNGYVTRTIDGEVIFNSAFIDTKTTTNKNPTPDHYRGLIAPPNIPLIQGFVRTKQEYTSTTDGKGLQYSIQDQQQYLMPPPGLTKIKGVRNVQLDTFSGSYTTTITVSGEGTAEQEKKAVYAQVANVLYQAFDFTDKQLVFAAGTTWSDRLESNYVQLTLTFKSSQPTKTQKGFLAPKNNLDNLTGIDGNRYEKTTFDVKNRGTANLQMLVLQKYLGMCMNSTKPMIFGV